MDDAGLHTGGMPGASESVGIAEDLEPATVLDDCLEQRSLRLDTAWRPPPRDASAPEPNRAVAARLGFAHAADVARPPAAEKAERLVGSLLAFGRELEPGERRIDLIWRPRESACRE